MKTYEQIIPVWRAVIPSDWELELEVGGSTDKTFESCSGRQIATGAGTVFRTTESGPAATWLGGAVTHGFVKELEATA